jgi:hypothetical protein
MWEPIRGAAQRYLQHGILPPVMPRTERLDARGVLHHMMG